LVFFTTYRRGVISERVRTVLHDSRVSVCRDFEAELLEFDGEDDHVHHPPKVSLSALVNSLKGVSSRRLRKQDFPEIRQKLWGDAFGSPSYLGGVLRRRTVGDKEGVCAAFIRINPP
jgi:putative transposase